MIQVTGEGSMTDYLGGYRVLFGISQPDIGAQQSSGHPPTQIFPGTAQPSWYSTTQLAPPSISKKPLWFNSAYI
jgi:hypothetical protein